MDDNRVRMLSEEILSDDWGRLTRYTLDRRHRDGSWHQSSREIYDRGNAAAVLPYDAERRTVLLVRQFRLPVRLNPSMPGEADGMLLEACAGLNEGNDPKTTILKEAEEELGYRLKAVEQIADVHMSPGSVAERITLYIAPYTPADRISDGGGLEHEGEDIDVVEMPLTEALDKVARGEITDAKTVIMLQHLKLASG